MIGKTLYAVSTDEARYNLNGLYVETDAAKGVMKLVATDGHRLALVSRKVEGVDLSKFDQGVVVPKKGILEVKRLLEEDDEPVEIGFRKGHAVVKKKDVLLVTRLIDAALSGLQPGPSQEDSSSRSRSSASRSSPPSGGSVSSPPTSRARSRIELAGGRLVISSTNPDVGEAREEIGVDYDGEALAIGFNARYLLDAIGAFRRKGCSPELQRRTVADDAPPGGRRGRRRGRDADADLVGEPRSSYPCRPSGTPVPERPIPP